VNARQQVLDKAHEELSKGNYADGAAYWLYAHVPLIGAQLAHAGESFKKGDIGAGAGESTGIGLNLVGPKAIKDLNIKLPGATPVSERMYQSALKPSTTLSATQRANVVKTGLDAGIPISPSGAEKLNGLISDLNSKIADQVKAGSQSGATIDPLKVAQRVDQIKSKFTNQVNPGADLSAIDASKDEFLQNNPGPIPASDAQALKQGTYQQLKGRSYGELKSATVEAQKALARGIKEELETQFPEIKGLNAQEAQFIGLDRALEKALNRIGNHQLVGIGTPIVAGAVGGTAGGPAGIAAGLMKALVDDPIVKSRLAIALNKAGRGAIPIGAAPAKIAAFSNLLGQAQQQNAQQQ